MLEINEQKALKLILLFALINSFLFLAFDPGVGLRLVIAALMNLSVLLLVISYLKLMRWQFDAAPYFKIVFVVLILWSIFTITRSISTDVTALIALFGHYLMAWAWITPLAIIFGFNIKNWVYLFKIFPILLVITILLSMLSLFMPVAYSYGTLEWMAFLVLMFLTFPYQSRMNKIIIIIALLFYFILSYQTALRIHFIFIFMILAVLMFEQIRGSSVSIIKKIIILFSIMFIMIISPLVLDNIENKMKQTDSLTTDTRTFLFVELFDDLSASEELIGRGALGTYYSPYFYMLKRLGVEGGDHYQRSISEVGYLQIIFKGGYVMLVLYLLILLPAAYLGIFRSNNYIARMSGYLILLYLIIWLVSYYPVYSAEYILLWMAVGTALSPTARAYTNLEVFNFKKEIDK